jgi:dsDNA-specific endonuclease/ATPase MutS2
MEQDDDDPISLPITDTLDLHTFHPREVKSLVTDYLHLAAEKGLTDIRIIHGKGTGTLRRIVHSVLDRHPLVASYRLAGDASGWGATLVSLRPAPPPA